MDRSRSSFLCLVFSLVGWSQPTRGIRFLILAILFHLSTYSIAQQKTYCNPVDIDYTYMSHYRAQR
ncbi:MAG: hypothetical protein RJQ14_02900, partial [Marinoscillum sp.]